MSELSVPIGLLDTVLAIVAGVIFTLVGIIYRKLKRRIDELETHVEELESNDEALMSWAFGAEVDPSNGGIATEIDGGFRQLNEKIEELQESMTEQQEKTQERLNRLVYELDSEDAVGIERQDIYDE
jgi:flagellar biosynthesis/type III secretory pathway M-ring protein FliF/YscJ